MTIRAWRQTNISKQTTSLDVVDVGPPKQWVCWGGLDRSVHEAMNNISNVKVHLKTRNKCKYMRNEYNKKIYTDPDKGILLV